MGVRRGKDGQRERHPRRAAGLPLKGQALHAHRAGGTPLAEPHKAMAGSPAGKQRAQDVSGAARDSPT